MQAEFVVGTATNLYIGEQAEQRAAPIRSSPRVRVIEPRITGLRQSLRHRIDQFGPYGGSLAISRPDARDAFHLRRNTFGQPRMLGTDFRQRQMNHLMHHHPISPQLIGRNLAADVRPNPR